MLSLLSQRSDERECWEKVGSLGTDITGRRSEVRFRRPDVRPAAQDIRTKSNRNGGRRQRYRRVTRCQIDQGLGRLPGKQSQLIRGCMDGSINAGDCCGGVVRLGVRACVVQVRRIAHTEPLMNQARDGLLSVGVFAGRRQICLATSQLSVGPHNFRYDLQECVVLARLRGLRALLRGLDGSPGAAPQVDFPGSVESDLVKRDATVEPRDAIDG